VFLYWDDIFGRQLSEDRMTREQALEQARRWRGRSAIRDEIHHRTYADPEKAARKLLEIANSVEAGLYSRSSAVENDRPPDSIDPDSMPGRLTLIEERLKAMSIELASLMAM
jgi:hypothetical protein